MHPKIAFLDLIDRARAAGGLRRGHRALEDAPGVVKINVAISELPDFIATPGRSMQDHHTGSVELCFCPDYAERAFQDAHMGRVAAARRSWTA